MQLFKDLQSLFNVDPASIRVTRETQTVLELEGAAPGLPSLDAGQLANWLRGFPARDTPTLSLTVGDGSSSGLTDITKTAQSPAGRVDEAAMIRDFMDEVEKLRRYSQKQDQVQVKLHVDKTGAGSTVSVYEPKTFAQYLISKPVQDLLKLFMTLQGAGPGLRFEFVEEHEPFGSDRIRFEGSSVVSPFPAAPKVLSQMEANSHFGNFEEFKFTPDHFRLSTRSGKLPDLNLLFDRLTLLYSLISIFDVTSIRGNRLSYRLMGYKIFEGSLEFNDLPVDCMDIYYRLFKWIYSEPSKIQDKAGLARNILSLSLERDSISIEERVYSSIESAYQVYIKENIERYIEIRNKIGDQLLVLSGNATAILANHVDNFKKSFWASLSFFISVFVLKFLGDGRIGDVFTKEPTILTLAFLAISFLFLLWSRREFREERERLKQDYQDLQDRFKDLLIEDDIKRILNNDREFNSDLEYIQKKQREYTWLWGIAILVLLVALLAMSSFLNWGMIWSALVSYFRPPPQ